jgi:hypothetical protein
MLRKGNTKTKMVGWVLINYQGKLQSLFTFFIIIIFANAILSFVTHKLHPLSSPYFSKP